MLLIILKHTGQPLKQRIIQRTVSIVFKLTRKLRLKKLERTGGRGGNIRIHNCRKPLWLPEPVGQCEKAMLTKAITGSNKPSRMAWYYQEMFRGNWGHRGEGATTRDVAQSREWEREISWLLLVSHPPMPWHCHWLNLAGSQSSRSGKHSPCNRSPREEGSVWTREQMGQLPAHLSIMEDGDQTLFDSYFPHYSTFSKCIRKSIHFLFSF